MRVPDPPAAEVYFTGSRIRDRDHVWALVKSKGKAVGRGHFKLPIGTVDRSLAAPLHPENLGMTRQRYRQVHAYQAAGMNAFIRDKFDYAAFDTLLRCPAATPAQWRAGRRVDVMLKVDGDKICVILPDGPDADAYVDFLHTVSDLAEFSSAGRASEVTGIVLVGAVDPATRPNDARRLARADYSALVREYASQLDDITRFIKKRWSEIAPRDRLDALTAGVRRLDLTPIRRSPAGRKTELVNPAAVLVDEGGTSDAKAMLLASLFLNLDRKMSLAIVETGASYLLGARVPIRPGDRFLEPGTPIGGSPAAFVLFDPNGGQGANGGRARADAWPDVYRTALRDGVLTRDEYEVLYRFDSRGSVRGRGGRSQR